MKYILLLILLSFSAHAGKIQQQGVVGTFDCFTRGVPNANCLVRTEQIWDPVNSQTLCKTIKSLTGGSGECSGFITATGGTITTSGNFKIHTFTSSGTFQVTSAPPGNTGLDYVLVSGGGGAGSTNTATVCPGGGAGGNVVTGTAYHPAVTSYGITIGLAGTGGGAGGNDGAPGGTSSFGAVATVSGSGTQGHKNNVSVSGSGGDSSLDGSVTTGGIGTTSGGTADGGGGAGATGNGTSGSGGGFGGTGYTTSLFGSPICLSGGGAGGNPSSNVGGCFGGIGQGGTGVNTGNGNAGGITGGGGGSCDGSSGGSGGGGYFVVRYQFQ